MPKIEKKYPHLSTQETHEASDLSKATFSAGLDKVLGKNLQDRAPADREASIKDLGFTRPGFSATVLCLHSAN